MQTQEMNKWLTLRRGCTRISYQLKWSNVNERKAENDTEDDTGESDDKSSPTQNCFLSETLLVITLRRNRYINTQNDACIFLSDDYFRVSDEKSDGLSSGEMILTSDQR